MGSAIGGALTANPIGAWLGGVAGGTLLGGILGSGTEAEFSFWNSDVGQYQAVVISLNPAETMLNSDGVTVTGSYSSACPTMNTARGRGVLDSTSCDGTVTITFIAN